MFSVANQFFVLWRSPSRGAVTLSDCNDMDATLKLSPAEVGASAFEKVTGGVRLTWTSQATYAGSATRDHLVTGSLNLLRTNGTFGGVNCLAAAAAEPPYDDFGAAPSPGEGFFIPPPRSE